MTAADTDPVPPGDRLTELRAAARGWHGVQLAVLGFIGLCGVLTQAQTGTPRWLELASGILALSALAVACLATLDIGHAAWPLYRGEARAGGDAELVRTGRRLRRGIALTFVAVALVALAAASSWWPGEDQAGGSLAIRASTGQSICGTPAAGRAGALTLIVEGGRVAVPIQSVVAMQPVPACP